MAPVLYDLLQQSDNVNELLRKDFDHLHIILRKRNAELGLNVQMPEPPAYNSKEVQHNLILRYERNPHIKRALCGEESLEATATRLGALDKSLFMTPHRKHFKTNSEVELLSELVPGANSLRRKGIAHVENGANALGYVAGLIGIPTFLLNYMGTQELIESIKMGAICGGAMGLVPGLGVWSSMCSIGNSVAGSGQYIDEKIKELF